MSIRQKLLLAIIIPVFGAYLLMMWLVLPDIQKRNHELIEDQLMTLSITNANMLNETFRRLMQVAKDTANFISRQPDLDAEQLNALLHDNVRQSTLIYGAGIAFMPGMYEDKKLYAPYIHRQAGSRELKRIELADYTSGKWEWWSSVVETQKGRWTAPYFDDSVGGIAMATYARPFFIDGQLAGVVTIDIPLLELEKQFERKHVIDWSYMIVTNSGRYVYHPEHDKIMVDTLFEDARTTNNSELRKVAQRMVAGESALYRFSAEAGPGSDDWIVAFAPIPISGWSIAYVLDQKTALDPIRSNFIELAVGLLLFMVWGVAVVWLVTRRMMVPLRTLDQATRQIAGGQLNAPIPVNSNDEFGHLASAFRNMAQRLAERERTLRDSRGDRFAHLLDSTHGKYFYFSQKANGEVDYLSQAAASHLAISDKEAKQNLSELLKERPSPSQFDVELQTHDGRTLHLELSTYPLYDANGQLLSIEGLASDVSARQQEAEALALARQQAEQASQYKSEFLANMSHEIRTPMNAILGMSHLCLQTELQDNQRNYVQKVDRAARNLLGLINDILDFSKIEAGKLALEKINFDLNDTLDGVLDLYRLQAEEKQLALHFDIAPQVPRQLLGDPLRLSQVLINLLTNAIKFTEQGEVTVSCQLKSQQKDTCELQFAVSDTGIGLSPEQQKRLFQPFTQADGSTTRKFGGTGLGLSICRSLVELMDGEIWLQSEQGKGSTFFFSVRCELQAQSEQPANSREKAVNRLQVIRESLVGKQVLLVEDNEINQEVAREILTQSGLKVTVVGNGRLAVDRLKASLAVTPETPASETSGFDLVLMDIQMPVMDGYEATRRLREIPAFAELPIVAMTANAMSGDREKCLEVGMNDHIAKPIDLGDLYRTLGRYLSPPEP